MHLYVIFDFLKVNNHVDNYYKSILWTFGEYMPIACHPIHLTQICAYLIKLIVANSSTERGCIKLYKDNWLLAYLDFSNGF